MATKTIQKGQHSETIASALVFLVCVLSAWAISAWWQTNETASEPAAAPVSDSDNCEVYVLSVNVGDKPWFVFSNYETEPGPNGTVEVKTTSQSDYE